MMLTEDTANYLGLDDRVDAGNSIFGGARFYARQTERIPDTVDNRTAPGWRLRRITSVSTTSRTRARSCNTGRHPDSWIELEQALPMLAQRQWYVQLPFGYARRLGAGAVRRRYPLVLQSWSALRPTKIPEAEDARSHPRPERQPRRSAKDALSNAPHSSASGRL